MLAIYQGTVVKFADTALPKAYKSPCLHGMYLLKSIWIPLFIRKCHWLGISFHLPFLNEPHRSISRFFTLLFLPGCQLRVTLSLSLGSSVHLFLGGPVTNCQDDHIEQNTTFYNGQLEYYFHILLCWFIALPAWQDENSGLPLWFVIATHTPMPLNPRGQVSLQHITFTQYLPCCCHGRIQGERKLAFIFILATKYLCYFKQGTFSIFCFMRILDSVSEPRTFSPSTIYQGALWWWRPHALFLFSQKDLFPTSLSISILSLLSVSLFPLKTQVIVHKVLTRAFCIQIKSFTLFSKFFFFFLIVIFLASSHSISA